MNIPLSPKHHFVAKAFFFFHFFNTTWGKTMVIVFRASGVMVLMILCLCKLNYRHLHICETRGLVWTCRSDIFIHVLFFYWFMPYAMIRGSLPICCSSCLFYLCHMTAKEIIAEITNLSFNTIRNWWSYKDIKTFESAFSKWLRWNQLLKGNLNSFYCGLENHD